MELRTASPRKYAQPRLLNHCAQCGETIFLPEWSEYLDRHRVRHLWECEACGYKFETLVTFPRPRVGIFRAPATPRKEPPAVSGGSAFLEVTGVMAINRAEIAPQFEP